MIQYICDICKEPNDTVTEIVTKQVPSPVNDIQTIQTFHLCPDCYQKFIKYTDKVKTALAQKKENEKDELADEKTPKFYDFTCDYHDMELRNFLRSPFYMESKNTFIFRSTDNKIINDFEFWMSHKIITVHPPTDAHSEIIVTLQ